METNRAQSEFNMAVSYLNRLNALFYVADEAAMELDAYRWFHTLLALLRELSTEMRKEEIKDFNDRKDDINELVSKQNKQNMKICSMEVTPELYTKLHNFELDLRSVMKTAGLQLKMMDDASNALV